MARKHFGKSWAWTVSDRVGARRRFTELVADVLDSLPEQIRRRMDNVEIVVEDDPPPGPLLGLYHGIPLTSRDQGYAGVLPDVISIYRSPLEARCRTEEDLAAEVRRTVLHEIAHHFGISDERLREIDRY